MIHEALSPPRGTTVTGIRQHALLTMVSNPCSDYSTVWKSSLREYRLWQSRCNRIEKDRGHYFSSIPVFQLHQERNQLFPDIAPKASLPKTTPVRPKDPSRVNRELQTG